MQACDVIGALSVRDRVTSFFEVSPPLGTPPLVPHPSGPHPTDPTPRYVDAQDQHLCRQVTSFLLIFP